RGLWGEVCGAVKCEELVSRGGQVLGQRAAARSGSDDDDVVSFHGDDSPHSCGMSAARPTPGWPQKMQAKRPWGEIRAQNSRRPAPERRKSSPASSIPSGGAVKYSHQPVQRLATTADPKVRAGLRLVPEIGAVRMIQSATRAPATSPVYPAQRFADPTPRQVDITPNAIATSAAKAAGRLPPGNVATAATGGSRKLFPSRAETAAVP